MWIWRIITNEDDEEEFTKSIASAHASGSYFARGCLARIGDYSVGLGKLFGGESFNRIRYLA